MNNFICQGGSQKMRGPSSSLIFMCLEAILNTQIPPGGYFVILGTDLILNFPQVKIDSKTDMKGPPLLRKPDLYIADMKESPLNETIRCFEDKTTFNPRAKFIFLTERMPAEDDIAILTKFFISNVIFITQFSGEISTYYPYKKKAIHDLHKEVVTITTCSSLIGNKRELSKLFEVKVPKTWNDSLIKFCYSWEPPFSIGPDEEKKGLNLDIFGFIAGLIRLKPVWTSLKYPEDGNLLTYSKNSIKTNEICDLNCELYPVEGADFTQPHIFDEVPFFVPSPLQIPRWQYLLKCLTIEIWIFWFSTSFILSLSWLVFQIVLEKRCDLLKMLEVLWLNLEYFIEKSHEVTKNYNSSRILFFTIFLQSFLLNMIFKCNFNLVLSGVIFEKPIESLQDVVDRKLVFGLFQLDETKNILKIVGDRGGHLAYAPCDSSDICFNRTAFDRDMALHQSLKAVKYRLDKFVDENGSPLMVKLDPPYRKVGLSAILPLGHPLTTTLDRHILLMHAYGFDEFFMRNYNTGDDKKLPFQLKLSKLSLQHIMAPSALLVGGYIAGIAVVLLEIGRGYKKKQLPFA